MARASMPNPDWVSLPEPTSFPKVSGTFDDGVAGLQADVVLRFALQAYDAVKRYDERVSIDEGKFSVNVDNIAISNTLGIGATEKSTFLSGYLMCIAKEAGEASSFAFEYDLSRSMSFYPEKIGEEAARKALSSLRPRKSEPFSGQVILEQDPAARILFYPVFYSVNADNVQRARSLWRDRVGEQVAATSLSIVDDGVLPSGVGSSSFDDEGVSRQKTTVMLKGVLKGYIYDSFTANKEKRRSTGNAGRGGYSSLPSVAASNFVVEPKGKKLDELVSQVDRGIIVGRFSGTVRPDSGEFSGVAKQAHYVEKGEIKYPLKETMVSGNAFEALKNVVDIGSESRPTFSGVYTPPVLIDKVNIVSAA